MTSPDGTPSEHDPTIASSPAGPTEPTQAMPAATPPGEGGGASKRWWWVVGGVVVVMIIVIAAALVLRDRGGDDTAVADPTTTTTEPATTTTAPAAATTTQPPATTAPSSGPQIHSFTGPASAGCPADVDPGPTQPVQLSWSVANADEVTIGIDNPGPYDTYPPSGSASLPFTCPGPHSYHLVAKGPGGQATEVLEISGS